MSVADGGRLDASSTVPGNPRPLTRLRIQVLTDILDGEQAEHAIREQKSASGIVAQQNLSVGDALHLALLDFLSGPQSRTGSLKSFRKHDSRKLWLPRSMAA